MPTEAANPLNEAISLQPFKQRLKGVLLGQKDDGYEAARRVFNAMIDRHPAFIVMCAGVSDVVEAIGFARQHDLAVAVRGGGHSAAGLGTVDGGLVIDLSGLREIQVNPVALTVRVAGGCTWGEVDRATHAFGLAVPSGLVSTTGVGGLTLGGGTGYLTRQYGLTIDNLLEVEMVLADGRPVKASASENPDLFWAVRGGGGNFGVVVSYINFLMDEPQERVRDAYQDNYPRLARVKQQVDPTNFFRINQNIRP